MMRRLGWSATALGARAVMAACVLLCADTAVGRAQTVPVRTAVVPDTITVGDVFHAAVRVHVPLGSAVEFPDSLVLPTELENAGDRVLRADTTASAIEFTALYPMAAWRPGAHAMPPITFTVNGAPQSAAFDSLRIASVLPADTTGIEAKPLKPVVGGTRVWWPYLLALLALLIAAAMIYRAWRKLREAVEVQEPVPARPARVVALERLEHARAAKLVEHGDIDGFYTEISGALRWYVAEIDPMIGQDLATSEIAAVLRRRGADAAGIELLTLLAAADLVKFARRSPTPSDAYADWTRITQWVSDAPWPPQPALATTPAGAPGSGTEAA